ncbi:hypothetical protein [Archangium sp.]|uniref:hypothetical protein n=1 Tax=Archangium sp. TaxID=1872627 RepID=UPI002D477F15|nr:hypothetical protein [Archangium sp.]HYO55758.1 hypothetical protein [Archangium sp.]
MDDRFEDIASRPENSIFQVVFFPDRVYHAQYLNATRSPRYRYNVTEVRSTVDVAVLKGQVYLDGRFLSNFLRIEYRGSRLVELARERNRLLGRQLVGWMKLHPRDASLSAEAEVRLEYCRWTDAYQVEIWQTLEVPTGARAHDLSVLDQMGRDGAITRVRTFDAALNDIKGLKALELAFREGPRQWPSGRAIPQPEWDNNFGRTHQELRVDQPSAEANTVRDLNYYVDFQRGFLLQAEDVKPIRYLNAMMDGDNPDVKPGNIIEMRWLLQRELGGSLIFFHEVTLPPGKVEGTHQHIGTEELYYVVEGKGVAYLGEEDDPALASRPTVEQHVFGLGKKACKAVPVRKGSVLYTKSGGIHGIRNEHSTQPLKFVAFLYHTA